MLPEDTGKTRENKASRSAANPGNTDDAVLRPFLPAAHLRHPMVQTVLASLRLRVRNRNSLKRLSREILLETADGVRLKGYHAPRPDGNTRGIVILLHGWEGSADSAYILSAFHRLFSSGFSVVRLNYRDHGGTHHLNRGLFWATNLAEVFEAVTQAAALEPDRPAFLAGFSLGGNFALRIAARCSRTPIDNLRHVVAVSPVIDPDKSTRRIDTHPLLLWYFLRKWRRSLKQKQRLFPADYRFEDLWTTPSVFHITDAIIRRYGHFEDIHDYFSGYTVTGERMNRLEVATTVVTARDDPLIPVEDFDALRSRKNLQLIIHPHGGHNGFIERRISDVWHDRTLADLFAQHGHTPH